MDARDVVRSVLDLLDTVDQSHINQQEPEIDPEVCQDQDGEQTRFRQIYAMLDKANSEPEQGYANQPDEVVSDIDTVTTQAGGGMNARKHPDDIRVKDPRGYE